MASRAAHQTGKSLVDRLEARVAHIWAATTDQLSGLAAAAGIALINAMAQFAGMGLPPLVGRIKDATGSYDAGILLIAAALAVGGLLGLRVAGPGRRTSSGAVPAHA